MAESTTGTDLLQQAVDGNQDAFSRLVDADRHRLRQMIDMRLDDRLRTRVDVSDILQETWLTAFARLADYQERKPASFYVWLRMVAGELIIQAWRRHMKAERRSVDNELPLNRSGLPAASSMSFASRLVGRDPTPSRVVGRLELCAHVQDQLEQLELADREILVMRHFEQLTNVEVAEILKIEPSAASNRYVRALQRLKKSLGTIKGLGAEWGGANR